MYNDKRCIFPIVALMTIAGFCLRLYHLDWQCLKVDEIVTQTAALMPAADIVRWALSVDYNPPLYYLAAHYSSLLFGGATAFAIRFPALLCSTALIPLSYLLGKEMKDTSLGYLMAGIATFLFPYFYYAQDARAYPMVLMFFAIFLVLYIRAWNCGFDTAGIFLTGTSIAGCIWTHYYVALPIAILIAFLVHRFIGNPKQMGRTFISLLVAVALLLPLAAAFDVSQFGSRTNHAVFNVLWNTPALIAMTVTNEMLCWSWIVLIPLALYAIWKYRKEESIFTSLSTAIAISTLFLIPMAHFTAVMPRYALVSTPMILLLALYPVSIWVESQKSIEKKFATIALFLLVILAFNFGSIYQWLTFSICPLMAV